jgi:cation:H+ antiporter
MSYLDWAFQYPFAFHIAVMLASLAIVVKAADLLVTGAVGFAQKFGLSDHVTGFLIIGIGTSLPEFISSLMGSGIGDSGIIFGTVLGSAVLTVNLVLGIEAYVAKTLPIEAKMLGLTKYLIPLFMALPVILVLDGQLSRADGIIMLSVFAWHLWMLWQKEGKVGKLHAAKIQIIWKDMFIYLGAFAALLLAARFLVFSAVISSATLGIPTFVIALFIIGIGASVGDLMIDLKSIRMGHKQLAIGDLLSGLVVETLFILGVISLIKPITVNPAPIAITSAFAIIPLAIVLFFVKKEITRKHGIILASLYFIFAAVQIAGVMIK